MGNSALSDYTPKVRINQRVITGVADAGSSLTSAADSETPELRASDSEQYALRTNKK